MATGEQPSLCPLFELAETDSAAVDDGAEKRELEFRLAFFSDSPSEDFYSADEYFVENRGMVLVLMSWSHNFFQKEKVLRYGCKSNA